ncbi:drug resistance transporter, EmrB/QacA subfamily [Actinokineospora globicatena]|uniref:MFS transporter n=1 Tax=Actinokineospora globicatena TaxID=103729 RepID=A0A9W6QV95_9PSEU|nr:drug resistance transporter, EmrB/QacA subfamily [Actinokineospora globicatena]GLW76128.1 MFS transporter [Actinokineospora globicatena]GLW82963.1 MFS transporter [Actinokineospora globicatena]GLW95743.1 MFS transporter [Actinokineospora globicatena]
MTLSDSSLPVKTSAPPEEQPDHGHAKRWLILAVIAIAQVMVILDATVVNIALPSAQEALRFTDDQRQWLITGYALSFGSLLLIGGRVADLFGRKITFLVGVAGFALASAVGGAAGSFEVLVAARVGQGVFAALLAPAALSLLTTTFTDPAERGKAFGIFGAISGAGGAIGLLLGGVLTEYLNWRWCMYVNLFFAAIGFIGGIALLAKGRESTERPRIDLIGVVTATAGMFALVFGLGNAESKSWSAPDTWGFLIAGAVLLIGFIAWQTKSAHPLLPLRILLHRNRGGSFLAIFVLCAGMFVIFLFLTYFMQVNLGFSPVESGLGFLPMIGTLMVGATLATTVLLPRVGPRLLVTVGMLLAGAGIGLLALLEADSKYAGAVLPALLIAGFGIGLTMASAMNVGIAGVDPQDSGVASAAINAVQQIGGSIGTALFSTIAATAVTDSLVSGANPMAAAVSGYSAAFTWSAILFGVGGVICAFVLRPGVPEELRTAGPAVHM